MSLLSNANYKCYIYYRFYVITVNKHGEITSRYYKMSSKNTEAYILESNEKYLSYVKKKCDNLFLVRIKKTLVDSIIDFECIIPTIKKPEKLKNLEKKISEKIYDICISL